MTYKVFSVGDPAQIFLQDEFEESNVADVIIKKIYPADDPLFDNEYDVELPDGNIKHVNYLSERDSPLEREFRNTFINHQKEIDDKLDLASKLIDEAAFLSEKYGLPFRHYLGSGCSAYMPESYSEKFKDLDREFMSELCNSYASYSGWSHSNIC